MRSRSAGSTAHGFNQSLVSGLLHWTSVEHSEDQDNEHVKVSGPAVTLTVYDPGSHPPVRRISTEIPDSHPINVQAWEQPGANARAMTNVAARRRGIAVDDTTRSAGRTRSSDVEISSDGTNWVRVGGDGVERKLSGYAPGTWWVRARTESAASDGSWFGPVSVNVK